MVSSCTATWRRGRHENIRIHRQNADAGSKFIVTFMLCAHVYRAAVCKRSSHRYGHFRQSPNNIVKSSPVSLCSTFSFRPRDPKNRFLIWTRLIHCLPIPVQSSFTRPTGVVGSCPCVIVAHADRIHRSHTHTHSKHVPHSIRIQAAYKFLFYESCSLFHSLQLSFEWRVCSACLWDGIQYWKENIERIEYTRRIFIIKTKIWNSKNHFYNDVRIRG